MADFSSFWRDYRQSFAGVLVVIAMAIGPSFLTPTPTLDSWFRMASWNDSTQAIHLFLSQQRFGQAALYWLLDLIGFRTITVAYSSAFIAALLLALTSGLAASFIASGSRPGLALFLACSLFCIQPNASEIFTFLDVTFDVQLSYFLTFAALHLSLREDRVATASAIILFIASISIYQLSANFAGCAIFLRLAHQSASEGFIKPTLRAGLTFLLGLISYFLIANLIGLLIPVHRAPRAELISFSDIPRLITSIIGWLHHALFVPWVKSTTSIIATSLLALSYLMIIGATFRKPSRLLLTIAALLGALLSTIGVVALSKEPWTPGRVFASVSVVISMSMLSAFKLADTRLLRGVLVTGGSLSLLGYMAADNNLFFDQKRLYEWDTALANRVMARFEKLPDLGSMQTVVFVGAHQFSAGLPTQSMDLNLSAFGVSYTQAPMFEQATGFRLRRLPAKAERDRAAAACATRAKWPAEQSVSIVKGVGIVCF